MRRSLRLSLALAAAVPVAPVASPGVDADPSARPMPTAHNITYYSLPLNRSVIRNSGTLPHIYQCHWGNNWCKKWRNPPPGTQRRHNPWAVDLVVPEGNNVYSMSIGKVIRSADRGCGVYLRISTYRYNHLYCHGKPGTRDAGLTPGQYIGDGRYIMKSGSSATSDAHLHVELRWLNDDQWWPGGNKCNGGAGCKPFCVQHWLQDMWNHDPPVRFTQARLDGMNCKGGG